MKRTYVNSIILLCGLALGMAACGDAANDATSDASTHVDAALSRQDSATTAQDGASAKDAASTADVGSSTPAGHTENNSGVMHRPGKSDPLANCTTCHGATLKGGTGPSCYTCHNNNSHTSLRGSAKIAHLAGPTSTCSTCHGPNNNGGLGPACSKCHN